MLVHEAFTVQVSFYHRSVLGGTRTGDMVVTVCQPSAVCQGSVGILILLTGTDLEGSGHVPQCHSQLEVA